MKRLTRLALGTFLLWASVGCPSGGVVVDVPPAGVEFTSAAQSVTEPDTGVNVSVTVTVQVTAASSTTIEVPYSVSGTATPGADHDLVAGSIIIAPGATTGSITFNVLGDNTDEPNETIILTMGTPVGAFRGSITTHTITIVDNDTPATVPIVSFESEGQTVGENVGSVVVLWSMTDATGMPAANYTTAITVPYTVSGTATGGGADHSLTTSGTLTFTIPIGVTSGTLAFDVVDDSNAESSETVILTLAAPTPTGEATITGALYTVHTVTIQDNDALPRVTALYPDEVPTNPILTSISLPHSYISFRPDLIKANFNLPIVGTSIAEDNFVLWRTGPDPVTGLLTGGTFLSRNATPITTPAGSVTVSGYTGTLDLRSVSPTLLVPAAYRVMLKGNGSIHFDGSSDFSEVADAYDPHSKTVAHPAHTRTSGFTRFAPAGTLIIAVDGGTDQTITFAAGDNTDDTDLSTGVLDAFEVAAAINARITGVTAEVVAGRAGGEVTIRSNTLGATSQLQITGGTALSNLGLTATASAYEGMPVNDYQASENPFWLATAAFDLTEGTIEFWVRFDAAFNSTTGKVMTIFSKDDPGLEGDDLSIKFLTDGRLNFHFDTLGSSSDDIFSNRNFWNAGQWYHIAATWSRTNTRQLLYVDGVLQNDQNTAFTSSKLKNRAPILMGAHRIGEDNRGWPYYFDGAVHGFSFPATWDATLGGATPSPANLNLSGFFKGALDEMRIWNVERSAAQIVADMKVGYRSSLGTLAPAVAAGLIAYWDFNDGSPYDATPITTAVDRVGGENATLGSNVWALSGWGESPYIFPSSEYTIGTRIGEPSWLDTGAPIVGFDILDSSYGNILDGEFSGTFPSGNNQAGGFFVAEFNILP